MDRDVFLISGITKIEPAEAIRAALRNIDLPPSRVEDAVFGCDGSVLLPDVEQITVTVGLKCPTVKVSSSLRAVFFAAQSILSEDQELVLAVGLDENASTALVLASPDAVGRFNLMPRARLAARSLSGPDRALRAVGLAIEDITIIKNGSHGAPLVMELLDALEQQQAQWGMASIGPSILLMERM